MVKLNTDEKCETSLMIEALDKVASFQNVPSRPPRLS
jgi:hypothetical protein